jgi:uncharacterized membrane protein YkvA (DUF1232 family)
MNIFRLNTDALWDGIRDWSLKAGRSAARPVLLMWYVMRSDKTPRKDKLAIFGSLAYLILPIDLLDAHRLPVVGWLDEAVSLAVLIRKMSKYITPETQAKVEAQLDKWFPEYTKYEIVE